jgi:hypothetical protein
MHDITIDFAMAFGRLSAFRLAFRRMSMHAMVTAFDFLDIYNFP